MRRVGIMIGSDSDLKQCLPGFKYLGGVVKEGKAEVVDVITNSIHRNTEDTLKNICDCTVVQSLNVYNSGLDVLIVGAGMANHLTGTTDAYLRYGLKNSKVIVIGVAFEGKTEEDTQAAILSIKKVPGTQVVFNDAFVGENGFLSACRKAVEDELPSIKLSDPKPVVHRSLDEAIIAAEAMVKEVK